MPHPKPRIDVKGTRIERTIGKVTIGVGVILILIALAAWLSEKVNSVTTPQSNTQPGAAAATAPQPDYPFCAETATGVRLIQENPTAELELNLKCWSGWIIIPLEATYYRISTTGEELEYLFLDGRRLLAKGKNEVNWRGEIPSAHFRLRGDGVAKIGVSFQSPQPPTVSPVTPNVTIVEAPK